MFKLLDTVMNNFTAIDFQIAQHDMCQVGLVHVTDGIITAQLELLVQPSDKNYSEEFENNRNDFLGDIIKNIPMFVEMWPVIEPFICNQNVVAHICDLDGNNIHQTLEEHGIEPPDFSEFNTYQFFKKPLSFFCELYGIKLEQCNALSNAMACTRLHLKYLNSKH